MGTCNRAHTLHVPHVGVVQGEFDGKKRVDVFWLLTRGRGEGELWEGEAWIKFELTRFSMTSHNNMYFNTPIAPSFAFTSCPSLHPALPSRPPTPCALIFSNASKKYEYAVVEYFSSACKISDWRSKVTGRVGGQ